jgi:hypothetical protein
LEIPQLGMPRGIEPIGHDYRIGFASFIGKSHDLVRLRAIRIDQASFDPLEEFDLFVPGQIGLLPRNIR